MNEPPSLPGESQGLQPITDAGRPETPPLPDLSPTMAGYPAPGGPRPLPRLVGYQVLEELGRGGMGVVFKARQHALNRVVALKMILSAEHASPEARLRFLGEAEAIARLRHPNIVQVHEFGTHDGCPYFSMEYIDGGSLAQQLRGQPLPAAAAAALVETLARAMQHAHERGIIHRDLKPANVLLARRFTEDPVGGGGPRPASALGRGDPAPTALLPKITDFGLAKRIEMPSGMTQTGVLVGTPSYMAPEQARAEKDVGPGADVYALGAVLYECLTGRPPFRAATAYETLTQVLHDEPVSVRQLQPGTSRDLETICLKCLHKESAQRYATAGDLADDLRAFQEGRPIRARPVGPWGRAVKWARRRPALAGLVAVSAGALLALAIGGAVHNHRLSLALREADRERRDALESRRLAVEVIDELLTQFAQERLKDVPEVEPIRKAMLERALTFYQRALAQRDDESLRREVGRAHRRVGDINLLLGNPGPAEEAYRAGAAVHAQGGDDQVADLAACHDGLGRLFHSQRQPEKAIEQWQSARELFDQAGDRAGVAGALSGIGAAWRDIGRFDQAGDAFAAALAIWEALPGDQRHRQAELHNELGTLDAALGRPDKARERFEKAVALLEPLGKDPTDSSRAEVRATLASAYRNLAAYVHEPADRVGAVERLYDKSRDIWEQLAARHPYVVAYQNGLADVHVRLGLMYGVTGRAADARRAHEKALAIMAPVLKRFSGVTRYHFTDVRARWSLGYVSHGQLARAEKLFDEVEPVLRELAARYPDNPDHLSMLGLLHHNRGYARENAGKWPGALVAYQEAVRVREQRARQFSGVASHRYDLVVTLFRLQNAYFNLRQYDKGDEIGRRAVEVMQSLVKDYPNNAAFHARLGWALLDERPLDRCLAAFDRAEELILAALKRDPADSRAHGMLRGVSEGRTYAVSKLPLAEQIRHAVEAAERTRRRLEQALTVAAYRTQLGWDGVLLSRLLAKAGRLAEAEMVLREGIAVMRPLVNRRPIVAEDNCHLAVLLCELGGVLRARGQSAAAAVAFEQAVSRQAAAVQGRPGNLFHRSTLLALYGKVCEVHLAAGQYRRAADVADRLAEEPITGMPELAFDAACWYARCSAAAAADRGLIPAERDRQSAAYAGRAIDLLRDAVRKGFRNEQRLKTEMALTPLHGRADFAAVVRSVQGR